MLSAGQLTERIALEKPVAQSNGQGGTIRGWALQFEIAARKQLLRGGEAVQADRLEGRQPMVLTIRRFSRTSEITAEWRARDVRSGAIYILTAPPEPSEDRRWVALLCRAGEAA